MSKAIVATAFALSLLYGGSAMAQQDDHHGDKGGGGSGAHGDRAVGGGGGGAPHNNNGGGGGGGSPHYSTGGGAPRYTGAPTSGGVQHTQSYSGGQYPHRGASEYGGGGGGGQGAGGPRGERPRYSEHDFPHVRQAERQYHWRGEWNPPHGFYYRHWGYGDRLPYGWFARDFWITDFWLYGLDPAPYGYAWVREGPDAVLVNTYTGMVVEVEPGVFF